MNLRRIPTKINLAKTEKSDLFADPQNILYIWTNYYYQMFNDNGVSDIWWIKYI
jgi:hypothetical protein